MVMKYRYIKPLFWLEISSSPIFTITSLSYQSSMSRNTLSTTAFLTLTTVYGIMSAQQTLTVGIVTCSTRATRVNPYITQHICSLLRHKLQETQSLQGITLNIIDLEAQSLPLYDEPAIPAGLPKDDPTPHYQHEHTRKWSAVVRAHDAFVFVTPQYNWSVPASLKNAIDYLYHEWAGKPAAVVTYGSRGGGRAAVHLQQILTGLKMRVAGTAVPLAISLDDINDCLAAGALSNSILQRWASAGVTETLLAAWSEMGGQ